MTENHVVKKLIRLIREGTSPYHVTANLERQFQKAGYKPLLLACPWRLQGGGCYYTVIQESALIAFSVGERMQTNALRIAAAHTDFPGLRLKQKPGLVRKGCAQLNVEVYGGAILNTWLDRPLSIAGRVSLRGGDVFHPVTRLVDFEKPLFVIPNLAIHLNRDAHVIIGTRLEKPSKINGFALLSPNFFMPERGERNHHTSTYIAGQQYESLIAIKATIPSSGDGFEGPKSL